MTNRLWEQALRQERFDKAKEIHASYVSAKEEGHVLDDTQEMIMEILGWIVLDNDLVPPSWEPYDD